MEEYKLIKHKKKGWILNDIDVKEKDIIEENIEVIEEKDIDDFLKIGEIWDKYHSEEIIKEICITNNAEAWKDNIVAMARQFKILFNKEEKEKLINISKKLNIPLNRLFNSFMARLNSSLVIDSIYLNEKKHIKNKSVREYLEEKLTKEEADLINEIETEGRGVIKIYIEFLKKVIESKDKGKEVIEEYSYVFEETVKKAMNSKYPTEEEKEVIEKIRKQEDITILERARARVLLNVMNQEYVNQEYSFEEKQKRKFLKENKISFEKQNIQPNLYYQELYLEAKEYAINQNKNLEQDNEILILDNKRYNIFKTEEIEELKEIIRGYGKGYKRKRKTNKKGKINANQNG